ncbi:MAG TPA: class I SAM-dependent methyltransferase [Chloroflexota bacterium]|nr:class I SAM-dependent methyltransferase [Chloroflexota bacterium]
MSDDSPASGLQEQLSTFWSGRAASRPAGTMEVRNDEEHAAWMESLRPFLPSAPVDALDVGTGQGFLALLLADLGHRVIGVDTAAGMLEGARGHAVNSANPPDFRLGNAMYPPLQPASVDVVSNRQVVWTLLDPAQAFRNWLALLRPGGIVLSVHLRQNASSTGSQYPDEVKDRLPALPIDATGVVKATRADRNYPDAVAHLARETGFLDVVLTSLAAVNRYEESIGTDRRWLVLTGKKPT